MSPHSTRALVAPILLLGSCAGGLPPSSSPGHPSGVVAALEPAAKVVATPTTATFELVMEVDDPATGVEVIIARWSGFFDLDGAQSYVEFDGSGSFVAAGEPVPHELDQPTVALLQDGTIYLRMPRLDELLGSSKWLSLDRSSVPDLPVGGGATHLQLLDLLGAAGENIVEVGRADIRGVHTTHYLAGVDPATALGIMTPADRTLVEGQLPPGGDLPLDAWLDEAGRPRRVRLSLGAVSLTLDLFDHGKRFELEVPPPELVTPYADVKEQIDLALRDSGR